MRKARWLIALLVLFAVYIGWQEVPLTFLMGFGTGKNEDLPPAEDFAPSPWPLMREEALPESLALHQPAVDPQAVIADAADTATAANSVLPSAPPQPRKAGPPLFVLPPMPPNAMLMIFRSRAIVGDEPATEAQQAALASAIQAVAARIGRPVAIADADGVDSRSVPLILFAKDHFDLTGPVRQVYEQIYEPEPKPKLATGTARPQTP